jgi:non-ribosomal peptide synthase protein (TIGR01720 family)
LPQDSASDHDANTVASARVVTGALSEDETHALLRDAPRAFNAQINDILLTALAHALGEWTDSPAVLIDLEGHGRESLFDDMDVSQTAGWFTSVFPVRLEVAPNPAQTLAAIRNQMRAMPNHGVGHGILRYLSDDANVARALHDQPAPQIVFNYMGRVDDVAASASLFQEAVELRDVARHPDNPRRYVLDVNAFIRDGSLRVEWTYSERLHTRATIEWLSDRYIAALRRLLERRDASVEVDNDATLDTSLAGLDQDELNKVSALLSELDE